MHESVLGVFISWTSLRCWGWTGVRNGALRAGFQNFLGLRKLFSYFSSFQFLASLLLASNWENQFCDHMKVSSGPVP